MITLCDTSIFDKKKSKTVIFICACCSEILSVLVKIMDTSKIEINAQFEKALHLINEGSKHVFITGKAGTGKSTLLEYFRRTSTKQVVVLAPTGVAAVNIRGQTIHSFFGFKPNITVESARRSAAKLAKRKSSAIYKEVEIIIIDEISMVRADLLDCIDQFLRIVRKEKLAAFGGVKMVFIGDLYQLPPVVTKAEKEIFSGHFESPYFFSSIIFPQLNIETVELEKIYRQNDETFIRILNAIRNNTATDEDIAYLNRRHEPEFDPQDDFFIYLTTINAKAHEVNQMKLAELHEHAHTFEGTTEGEFESNVLPTGLALKLKKGAQVMLLNNDKFGRWTNGTIGKVVDISDDAISVQLPDGSVEDVGRFTWELFNYTFDGEKHSIGTEVVGQFTQFPLKLAWAITIHKSQGKTFDRMILDLSHGTFATGQAYVALSRCRTLEGIVLLHEFHKRNVMVDQRIVKFFTPPAN